jgi:DNA anti-recombination protein RmuC
MQELINKLVSEAGLSAEQAAKSLQVVMDYVKSKVPSPLAANIDAMFSGAQAQAQVKEESFMNKAEDMAETAKDKLEDMAETAKDKLEDMAENAKDKLEDFAENAKDKIGDAAEKAEEMAKDAFNKLKGMLGKDKA